MRALLLAVVLAGCGGDDAERPFDELVTETRAEISSCDHGAAFDAEMQVTSAIADQACRDCRTATAGPNEGDAVAGALYECHGDALDAVNAACADLNDSGGCDDPGYQS